MPRLPEPGKDAGEWGTILNDFLSSSLAVDGSLKPNTVGSSQLQAGSVTTTALSDGSITAAKVAADVATQAELDALASGKADAVHAHSATDVTSGTLPLARGGTGGTDAATARTNLGLASAATMTPATLAGDSAFAGAYARLGMGIGGRFVVTGDSITAGGSDTNGGWWNGDWGVHCALASNGLLMNVWNAGHGGYTSTQLLALIDAEVLSQSPDIIGQLWGTNDTLDGSNRPTVTAANTKAAVAKYRSAGKQFFFGTLPPQGNIALGTPAAPTVTTATTGGTLAAGTYSYKVAALDSYGTTLASAASTIVTTGSTSANTVVWAYVPGAASYKVYGRTSGSELLVATIGQANGAKFWVDTGSVTPSGALPSSNTTGSAVVPTSHLKIATINNWLRRYCQQEHIPLVDFYQLLVDPLTGKYKAGYSSDGVHPSPTAQKMMGQLAWATIAEYGWAKNCGPIALSQTDPTNLYNNGLFGTNNGQIPASTGSYGGSIGVTQTVGPKTGFLGNAFVVDFTNSTAGARYNDMPSISSGFSVGDTIAFSIVIQTEGCEVGGGQVDFQIKGTPSRNRNKLSLTHSDIGPNIWTGVFTVPPEWGSGGGFYPVFYVSNGIAKASLGQVGFFNLTTGASLAP